MIRYPSILWVFAIVLIGTFIYEIKRVIIKKETEILLLKQIKNEKSDLNKLLNAELAYLSHPNRIEKIAKEYLNMKVISPMDIWDIKDLKPMEIK